MVLGEERVGVRGGGSGLRRRSSAHRRDDNHHEITDALTAAGWLVADTSQVGNGFPDLIAIRHGLVEFIEVKDGSKPPSKRRLSSDEQVTALQFAQAGKRIRVIETVEQAVSL